MVYDSKQDTIEHINRVDAIIHDVLANLDQRAVAHDASKLQEPEKEMFDKAVTRLKEVEYGTPEYDAAKAKLGPALDHHYAHNAHHPEHWPNGVDDMSLLDITEMLCDWKAASERMKGGGDIYKSIGVNTERFGLSDQLVNIFTNTAKEMGW